MELLICMSYPSSEWMTMHFFVVFHVLASSVEEILPDWEYISLIFNKERILISNINSLFTIAIEDEIIKFTFA